MKAGFAPVDSTNPPAKVMVAPVLLVRLTPLPLPLSRSVIEPLNVYEPPGVFWICTSVPRSSEMVPL